MYEYLKTVLWFALIVLACIGWIVWLLLFLDLGHEWLGLAQQT